MKYILICCVLFALTLKQSVCARAGEVPRPHVLQWDVAVYYTDQVSRDEHEHRIEKCNSSRRLIAWVDSDYRFVCAKNTERALAGECPLLFGAELQIGALANTLEPILSDVSFWTPLQRGVLNRSHVTIVAKRTYSDGSVQRVTHEVWAYLLKEDAKLASETKHNFTGPQGEALSIAILRTLSAIKDLAHAATRE